MFKDLGLPWEPEVKSAVQGQRKVFESLGCSIEEAEPDFTDANECFLAWRHWSTELAYGDLLATHGPQLNEYVHWHIEEGRKLTGPYLARVEAKRTALFQRLCGSKNEFDFFVLPVSQVLPFDVKTHFPTEIAGAKMENYMKAGAVRLFWRPEQNIALLAFLPQNSGTKHRLLHLTGGECEFGCISASTKPSADPAVSGRPGTVGTSAPPESNQQRKRMKDEVRRTISNPMSVTLRHLLPVMVALAVGLAGRSLALADDGGQGGNDGDQQDGNNGNLGPLGEDHQGITYEQINLVADLPGVAMLQDTNLVNAWGISFGPKTPFWISDNGTGLSTLYSVTNDMMGMPHVTKMALEVSIPGDGTPTGQLFNDTTGFHTNLFIFASEDGTISGWRPALGTAAEILVSAPNTVYKGITLVSNAMGPMLLAANFAQAKIDVYDTNMTLTQFSDDNAPDGYAPFNVENLGGMVLVTFAKQDDAKHDDVPGFGNGLIDVFDPTTHMFQRLVTGTDAGGNNRAINSPWGMTISPKGFGDGEEHLLVGNFGSGTIMSFDDHGRFEGLLRDTSHKTLVIDGLWGLTFGNGTKAGVQNGLYFTAGPDGESHGLFGNLVPVKPREHARPHRHGRR